MATISRNVSILVIGLMTVATTTPGLGQNSSVAKNLVVFHAITLPMDVLRPAKS